MLGETLVTYQWLRTEQLDQWWHWGLLAVIASTVLLYVLLWYRRDAADQLKPVGWALTLLRVAAFIGLLLYFMQLDKRSEQRVVRESKLAVLVDTSLSMSRPGTPTSTGVANSLSRAEEATQMLAESPVLGRLAEDHQVAVYRFDQHTRPTTIALLNKKNTNSPTSNDANADSLPTAAKLETARMQVWIGVIVAALACLSFVISWGAQIVGAKEWAPAAWLLLIGSLCAVASTVSIAWGLVPNTQYDVSVLWRSFLAGEDLVLASLDSNDEAESDEQGAEELLPEDWGSELSPKGTATRLGDSLRAVLDREAGNPLAGVVLMTDGRNNAGVSPRDVLALAQNARVPLYVIGLGSPDSPPNLELVEIDVPKRLYPGDTFSLNALVGSAGFGGKTATIQVLSGAVDTDVTSLAIEDELTLDLPADDSLATAKFELEPKSVGEWQYAVRVLPQSGEIDQQDNMLTANVEVVERKNRVLILAGGPTREYQFVRNLLYRDRDVESHVLLQTGTEQSSQEAQQMLATFPESRAELSEYDAVVAFDADWTQISDQGVLALEQWVGEQAGGFVMVAGSVEMPKWLARSARGLKTDQLRTLSPVLLRTQSGSLVSAGRVEATDPWPLELTSDGAQTEFLWLTDEPRSSLDLWNDFEGVYSFYSAYQLKPGAKALLNFSDPSSATDGQLPIYLATQFYGAGRTAYLGGGELWRIRSLGDEYFDRFYTKLVRWVSQGRLLIDSDRGALLADREQATLGDQVALRAVLKNERYEPLIQSEVVVRLIDPQQRNVPLVLRPLSDGAQPGVYTGQFPVLVPGEYTAQLQLGGLSSTEMLSASVKAKVPALEMQNVERNDDLLRKLAANSGGEYWSGVSAALAATSEGEAALVDSIDPQDQVAYLPGTPDQRFQLRWLVFLMTLVAGSLCLEWLSRRIHRLA